MRRTRSRAVLAALCFIGVVGVPATRGQGATSEQKGHDREYWKQIAKNHYAIPAGQEAFPLAKELSVYLGLPDPELRDDLAYSMLAVWITRQKKFSPDELLTLLEEW